MAIQHVLLVAGFNYENAGNPVFLQCCNNRMTRLLSKSKSSDDLVFTLFDVGGGVIQQSKVDPVTKKRSWKVLQNLTAVTKANYSKFVTGEENQFDKNPSGVMSITDVYAFVQSIGAGPEKGTVLELSFFSHGFMGGPIIVNSFDHSGSPTARDPNDKDGRRLKDFIAPNMDATALANFRGAFASPAVVWIWGCVFFRALNIILSQIFKTSKFRTTSPGKLKDADRFTLDFSEDDPHPSADDDFNTVVRILGGTPSKKSFTKTVSLLDIKTILDEKMTDAYAAAISRVMPAGVTVFAALPGTGTDYEELDKSVRLPLMLVPRRSPPYPNDFSRSVTFYKNYLDSALDPENHGYGAF
jgi:hypothetical protein